jgi:hypothetical protein
MGVENSLVDKMTLVCLQCLETHSRPLMREDEDNVERYQYTVCPCDQANNLVIFCQYQLCRLYSSVLWKGELPTMASPLRNEQRYVVELDFQSRIESAITRPKRPLIVGDNINAMLHLSVTDVE